MSNIETKKEKKSILNKIGGDKLILIAAIIIVFALFTFLNKNFLTWANMVNLLVAASLVGLVAVGHTYLIIAGQNDLSPGSLAAFCGTLAALLLSKNVPPVWQQVSLMHGWLIRLNWKHSLQLW